MQIRSFTVFTLSVLSLSLAFQNCSERKPPLSAQQALSTFELPRGFKIELAAAEPEVSDPVAMAFDARGRLYVVEMPDYPMIQEPLGRVKLLEDRDGDGRYEHSTVFAKDLRYPNGVMAWKQGVLVSVCPDIVYLADTDGDGAADSRRVELTGFAQLNPQLRMNGLLYAMDNWIYGAYPKFGPPRRYVKEFGDLGKPIGFPDHPEVPPVDIFKIGSDFRFRPDELRLEPVAGNSQFGNAFDEWGNRFTVWNNDHVRHVPVQAKYLRQNPYLGIGSSMQSASDHEKAAALYPITEKPLHLHESEIGHFTSACGISVYAGGGFPAPYGGAYFVCDPVHNVVHCDTLSAKGSTFVAGRVQERSEFLASRDNWFRPVFTTVGPDGALYVADYYRKLVEHPEYIPPEMIDRPDFRYGQGMGRIYRITYTGQRRGAAPGLDRASSSELVRQLSHENLWWRMTAQRILVERGDPSALPLLADVARASESLAGRIHSLWALEGMGKLSPDLVALALEAEHPRVREQALRLAEPFLDQTTIREKLFPLSADPDDRVQLQAACSLGLLPGERSFAALRRIALSHIEDPWFQAAVLASAAQNANRWHASLVKDDGFTGKSTSMKAAFVRSLSSITGARQSESEITGLLAAVDESGGGPSGWWRTATLHGLADGLARARGRLSALRPGGQDRLIRLLQSKEREVAEAAFGLTEYLELADSPQLRKLIRQAESTAANSGAPLEDRVHAVRTLGLLRQSSTLDLLRELVHPGQPQGVQIAASHALVRLWDPSACEIMLEKWPTLTAACREVILRGFFSQPERLHLLLDALEKGRIPTSSLESTRRNQLLYLPDERIRDRAGRLFAHVPGGRGQVLDKYRAALPVSGNVERGKEVYSKNCSKCHQVNGMGVEVGPDLSGVARRPKEEIMSDILDPNSSIAAGYENYAVETRDGRLITGVMVRESENSVTLRRGEGEEDTILRSQIASLRSLTISSMPEELESNITITEMADLLQFIKSLAIRAPHIHLGN